MPSEVIVWFVVAFTVRLPTEMSPFVTRFATVEPDRVAFDINTPIEPTLPAPPNIWAMTVSDVSANTLRSP